MDTRFQKMGSSANGPPNAFMILRNSVQGGVTGSDYCPDTALRLDSPGSSVSNMLNSRGIKRKWSLIDGSTVNESESLLSLKLGHSSSSSDSKASSGTAWTSMSSARETDDESSMDLDLDFSLHLGNEKIPSPKKPNGSKLKAGELEPVFDLELSLSAVPSESDICTHPNSSLSQISIDKPPADGGSIHGAEGSTSYCWKPAMALPFVHNSLSMKSNFDSNQVTSEVCRAPVAPVAPELSSSIITTPKSPLTCTSGITQQKRPNRSSNLKSCQIEGCEKGARGASGRCISHGGGRRCQKLGCQKGAEGRTVFCKAHGGGRRCQYLGCTKSAEGRTDYCIAHGGGRRCSNEGCTRAARGRSGLCIRHGGGKRCKIENCTKSAEGLSGLCISHGGGRRCQFPGCSKGAQGSTKLCKAHGGGKRCTFPGCNKGAEGSTHFCKGHGGGKRCAFQGGGICTKSVHGGTNFCVAHGGGKRCAVPECTKSARGRTDFCVRHGGGKRCKFEGCDKSAQGSTDFCKAHGGGKRCSWGHPGSEYGSQASGPCNSFARGKTGLCTLHSGLVQDQRVHGGATLRQVVQEPILKNLEKKKGAITAQDMYMDILNTGSSEMNLVAGYSSDLGQVRMLNSNLSVGDGRLPSVPVSVPEGRVHGGSLMALLAGCPSGPGSSSAKGNVGSISDPTKFGLVPQRWL